MFYFHSITKRTCTMLCALLAVSISDVVGKGRFVEPEISRCYDNTHRNTRGSNRLKKALNKVNV